MITDNEDFEHYETAESNIPSLFDFIIFSPIPQPLSYLQDSLTSLSLHENHGIKLKNNKFYDVLFLSKYVVDFLDYRDVLNDYELDKQDVEILSEACKNLQEENLGNLLKNSYDEKLKTRAKKYQIVNYYKILIRQEIETIINNCKLVEIVSLIQTQNHFDKSWKKLIQYFSFLLNFHPLEAGKQSHEVQKMIQDILAVAGDEELYIYEDCVLNPFAASLKVMCACISAGLLKFRTKDIIWTLDNLNSNRIQ
jgi:hypothetical protein